MLTLNSLSVVKQAVAQTQPAHTVSDKYRFFSTAEILKAVEAEGFTVTSTQLSRVRNPDMIPFARHTIKMRSQKPKVVGDVIPEIIITNDHMGKGALSVRGGLYRLVCSNGLIVPERIMETFRVPHIRHELGDVIEGVWYVVENTTKAHAYIEQMKATTLDMDRRLDFAQKALALRAPKSEVDPWKVIEPRRVDDMGTDLWRTFNVAQERLMGGLLAAQLPNGKQRKLRAVGNPKLNHDLFELALDYVA